MESIRLTTAPRVILLKDGKYVNRITHHDDIKESLKIIKKYL